ncbi:ankyrin repeat domain-containing protein [Azonexus sp.]|uniref:ankyrin repeat domain-containing protein n=1 Tax=Azonexus sp. TaxID=1872668 RepID=UPI0027B97EC8|nr:ankyrin repeat domain-containing protein [Azonexus sp.]
MVEKNLHGENSSTRPKNHRFSILMLLTNILSLFVAALMLVPSANVHAQPRDEKIDEIIQILARLELPKYRAIIAKKTTDETIHLALKKAGEQQELGYLWKPGNTHWDSAVATILQHIQTDYEKKTGIAAARSPLVREALNGLTDIQLNEISTLFLSDLFSKSVSHADNITVSIILGSFFSDLANPEESGGFPKEFKQFKQMTSSPQAEVFQQIGLQTLISTLRIENSSVLMISQTMLSKETISEVVKIINSFRIANHIPPPLPPEYAADFITDKKKEKEARKQANAAIRGDINAFEMLVTDAQNGDPIAQAELGRIYTVGINVPQDHKAAFEWTQKAADHGLPRALYNLGLNYQMGNGVEKNLIKAEEYYRLSADKGFARAQLTLGLMYRNGNPVAQDYQRSLALIQSAANQRLPSAALAMAEIYDAGAGVWPDEKKADIWLKQAEENGLSAARAYRKDRKNHKAQFQSLLAASPASAKASPTSGEKSELNRRLISAVKEDNIAYASALLAAGTDIETRDQRPYRDETPLHHAARKGSIDMAAMLISHGANVNVTAQTGFTPLHVAAGLNKAAMVSYLLRSGANVNALDTTHGMPLHAATVQGHPDIVQLLLSSGANPNGVSGNGVTPLRMIFQATSYYKSHTKILDMLINAGADLFDHAVFLLIARRSDEAAMKLLRGNYGIDWAAPPQRENMNLSIPPVVELACAKKEMLVRYLLSEHPDRQRIKLNASGPWGTPLNCYEWKKESLGLLEYLLMEGFDPNAADSSGVSVLHRVYDQDAIDILLRYGADPNRPDKLGQTPIYNFVVRSETDLSSVIAKGYLLEKRDRYGRTPLHYAYNLKVLDFLIAHGMDINERDLEGKTPLHTAAERGRAATITSLLKHGADANIRTNYGLTVYHLAAKSGDEATNKALFTANPEGSQALDNDGKTPLHYAAESGYGTTIEILMACGANVNQRDKNGDTPLISAARKGNAKTAYFLVKNGADGNITDKNGKSASEIFVPNEKLSRTYIDKALKGGETPPWR